MTLDAFIRPWEGDTFRHIPADAKYHILDLSRAGTQANNRWNTVGQPTLYVAGDRGVASTEFSRHLERDRPPAVVAGVLQRRLYRLRLRIDFVFDLCQPAAWRSLSLDDAPHCFLDRELARATAQFIRATTPAQAIRVPSVAFLDDLTRWMMVLFLEKLPADSSRFIRDCAADDVFLDSLNR